MSIRRDVPVYNVETVQVLERTKQFGSVETTSVFVKLALSLQVIEQFTTVYYCDVRGQIPPAEVYIHTKRHDQIQFIWCLERKFQRHDERVVYECQYGSFSQDMRDFSRSRSDIGFSNGLESVYTLCILLSNLHNLSETSLSNNFEQIELVNSERLMAGGFKVHFEVE